MMESPRLKKNLDLLLNAGVSPNNILKDVWSLRTKSEFVEERLCRANEVGLPDPKPWLVRCQIEVFERTLERHMQSRAILGSKSFHQFLADRLGCDVQAATVMVQRYPTVLHVNIPKINEILDFLREEGFSMEQVLQVPRILCHSLETTRARLGQLHARGFHPVSLMVLCLSQPDYLKMVRRLEQRRAKVAQ
ncbi:transcription termination factor, mitochondrial isoform X2 [Bacillus rossius redtenbacheri]